MAFHKEHRRLDYSPQQIFDLVAEVEKYPSFLPLWREARVAHRTEAETGLRVYTTDQVLQIGPFQKRFRTNTNLVPHRSIRVTSTDPLFQRFSIHWAFSSVGNSDDNQGAGCLIDFSLNCVARSPFLQPVFEVALLDSARSIVSTFEKQARFLYGEPDAKE